MIGLPIIWRLRTLAFVALALAGFGAIECHPVKSMILSYKAQYESQQYYETNGA